MYRPFLSVLLMLAALPSQLLSAPSQMPTYRARSTRRGLTTRCRNRKPGRKLARAVRRASRRAGRN